MPTMQVIVKEMFAEDRDALPAWLEEEDCRRLYGCTGAEMVRYMQAPVDPSAADRAHRTVVDAGRILLSLTPDPDKSPDDYQQAPEVYVAFRKAISAIADAAEALHPVCRSIALLRDKGKDRDLRLVPGGRT